jgi:hypothetical protein
MPNTTTAPARVFFVEEDLGDGYAQVQRDDVENSFDSLDEAIEAAESLWVESGNERFLGLPCYRVASVEVQGHRNYGVSADPIDVFPYER